MFSLNTRFFKISLVSLGILVVSGCATKKYVRSQTEALQPAIQEATDAAKENAERLDSVDKRAQQGITAAAAADRKAAEAQQAATAAQAVAELAEAKADDVNRTVQRVNRTVQREDSRINSLEVQIAGINEYMVSLTRNVTFAVNSSSLSSQDRAALDHIAGIVGSVQTGYMLELQGFTDNSGSEQYNINLSRRRAESVQRYLVGRNVPLFRISILGLGDESPVADNKTKAGRSQNRRVEVRILTSTGVRQTN
jgi:OmpA-OmpF porin, OOP family